MLYNSYMNIGESRLPMLLPRPEESELAIGPPGAGPGYWAGAPSAVLGDDGIYLAYRLRRPVGRGRGYAHGVARSEDGVHFETLLHHRPREDRHRVAGAPLPGAHPRRVPGGCT